MLNDCSATELQRLIRSREASPVEVVQSCIARIEQANPIVNAIAATCFDRGLEEAREAERRVMRGEPLGLLHGLPLGIKDLEPTQGLLTTFGSPFYNANIPSQDNLLVRRLRAAGGIVLCKTNVPELGPGANTRNPVWGATGNPFDPNLTVGGSSGGSAAALATNMLPLCSGSDAGGSLRLPASFCGVAGFRPSPGLVPTDRKMLGFSSLSVAGPMARCVDDLHLQLRASIGASEHDPLSYEDTALQSALQAVDLRDLKVGWTTDFGCCDVDAGIREAFARKLNRMGSLFQRLEEVPLHLHSAHRCFDLLRTEMFLSAMKEAYDRDRESLGTNSRTNYEYALKVSGPDLVWAHAEHTRVFRSFHDSISAFDIVLAPAVSTSPFPWTQMYPATIDSKPQDNYYRWASLTYVGTLLATPILCLPCGTDHLGMPFGVQVIGRFRQDARLLAIGRALEAAFGGTAGLERPQPDLSTVRAAVPTLRSIVSAPPPSGHASTDLRLEIGV